MTGTDIVFHVVAALLVAGGCVGVFYKLNQIRKKGDKK